jgi:bis(5'-nucleosidyl)-tetraphosphatase
MTEDAHQAAGYILYRWDPDDPAEPLFLMMCNAMHGTWGVPKGHLEPGEDLISGARRELEEETGLSASDVSPVDGFHCLMRYRTRRRGTHGDEYWKDVHLFLAGVPAAVVARVVRSEEHSEVRWADMDTACQLARHQQLINALQQANRAIREQANPPASEPGTGQPGSA